MIQGGKNSLLRRRDAEVKHSDSACMSYVPASSVSWYSEWRRGLAAHFGIPQDQPGFDVMHNKAYKSSWRKHTIRNRERNVFKIAECFHGTNPVSLDRQLLADPFYTGYLANRVTGWQIRNTWHVTMTEEKDVPGTVVWVGDVIGLRPKMGLNIRSFLLDICTDLNTVMVANVTGLPEFRITPRKLLNQVGYLLLPATSRKGIGNSQYVVSGVSSALEPVAIQLAEQLLVVLGSSPGRLQIVCVNGIILVRTYKGFADVDAVRSMFACVKTVVEDI